MWCLRLWRLGSDCLLEFPCKGLGLGFLLRPSSTLGWLSLGFPEGNLYYRNYSLGEGTERDLEKVCLRSLSGSTAAHCLSFTFADYTWRILFISPGLWTTLYWRTCDQFSIHHLTVFDHCSVGARVKFGTHCFQIAVASTAAAMGYFPSEIQSLGWWHSAVEKSHMHPVMILWVNCGRLF